jgi:hypothetical protein
MPANIPQIRDIHGLDPISWWPPGPGWWLIALIGALMVAGLWLLLSQREHPLLTARWQRDARRRLRSLRRRQSQLSTKEVAGELSELLRRIAMARFGRRSCAGLVGEDWITWLDNHDPAGFDWQRNAVVLLELPYAPPGRASMERTMISLLIDAALAWVSASEQTNMGAESRV